MLRNFCILSAYRVLLALQWSPSGTGALLGAVVGIVVCINNKLP